MISDRLNLKNSTIVIRSFDSEPLLKFCIEEILYIESVDLVNGICKCRLVLPNTNKNDKIYFRWLSYIKRRGFVYRWDIKSNELGYDRSSVIIEHFEEEQNG